MCGICGMLGHTNGFIVDEPVVREMRDVLTHRGPDDAGTWHDPNARVALGHRRLAIVDLSSNGRQPLSNEDGSLWITFNGEIYNHADLRRELVAAGHSYRSDTDTESILHLYEEEGAACVERLQGMFAFAIWDARREELFLARDRLGIKPLYYADGPGGFVFGSEIKAVLRHPAVGSELDADSFVHYLTFASTPSPRTMFAGISKLAAAERMTVGAGGAIRRERYWEPMDADSSAAVSRISEQEMEERFLELLRASIRKRTMADVPFGVLLSGGVDSSTNVALMAEMLSEPVRTFSVGFRGDGRYNELDHARAVARHFGTEHHELLIGEEELEAFLPSLFRCQDEPIADWVSVPLHYVSQLARESGTVVVQVGEGADELLHGYEHFLTAARLERRYGRALGHLPLRLGTLGAGVAMHLARRAGRGMNTANFVAAAATRKIPFWGGAISFRGPLKEDLMTAALKSSMPDSHRVVEQYWQAAERLAPDVDLLQRMTYLEMKQRLSELLLMRVDKMTMATSVEARVPFLDHDLVEFAFALPESMKVRRGKGKHILRKVGRDLLPAGVLDRPKQGFTAPVGEWFRGPLGVTAQREIRRSSLAERELLNYDFLDELWKAHRAGRGDWSFQLWNIYNVSRWHDRWIAGRSID